MSERTNIPYADSTVNFWSGCTPVAIGCENCYARRLSERWPGKFGQWGKDRPRKWHEGAVKMALRLNKKPWICDRCGMARAGKGNAQSMSFCNCGETNDACHRRRVFANDLSDWLDEEVQVEWLGKMLDTIGVCQDVIWLLLSKRLRDFRVAMKETNHYCKTNTAELLGQGSLKNVWIGASASSQADLDKIVPDLLNIPAKVRWLSLEPLLGPINLMDLPNKHPARIDWVVVGGESGPGYRPCNVEWIGDIVMQCRTVGAPVWVKQDSDPRPGMQGPIPAELWNVKELPR